MLRKSDILKCLSILPILFVCKSSMFIDDRNAIEPVAELFLKNIFTGNPSRTETDIVTVMFDLIELVLFNLLYGAYIYRDLYENSVYIFVRQRNRAKWFRQRLMELFGYCVVYNTIFLGTIFALSVFWSNYAVDNVAINAFVSTYVMLLMFSYWTTVVINILAVRFGSTFSFIICYVGMLILSLLAINHEKIPVIGRFDFLLKFNPLANVIVRWNDGIGQGLYPAMYFVILIVITILVGKVVVERMDIGLENREKSN